LPRGDRGEGRVDHSAHGCAATPVVLAAPRARRVSAIGRTVTRRGEKARARDHTPDDARDAFVSSFFVFRARAMCLRFFLLRLFARSRCLRPRALDALVRSFFAFRARAAPSFRPSSVRPRALDAFVSSFFAFRVLSRHDVPPLHPQP
jgi:hypothetical protein